MACPCPAPDPSHLQPSPRRETPWGILRLSLSTFEAVVRLDASPVVECAGAYLHPDPGRLLPFLEQVHALLRSRRCAEVTLDLRHLDAMTPTAFHAFVYWLTLVEEARPSERYRVRLRLAPERSWQRIGLYLLQGISDQVQEEREEAGQ